MSSSLSIVQLDASSNYLEYINHIWSTIPNTYANYVMCSGIINKSITGQIWIPKNDDSTNEKPCCFFLLSNIWSFVFGVIPNENVWKSFCSLIKDKAKYIINVQPANTKLIQNENNDLKQIFDGTNISNYAIELVDRLQLLIEFPNNNINIPVHINNNSDYIVIQYNNPKDNNKNIDVYKRCQWYNFMNTIAGDEKQYLSCNNTGFVLIDFKNNDTIISECHSFENGTNAVELGITTHENYRKKGYACIVVSAMINYYNNYVKENAIKSFTLFWSCDEANIGSSSTAKKCGFPLHSKYQHFRITAKTPDSSNTSFHQIRNAAVAPAVQT